MRNRIAAVIAGLALVGVPAAANAQAVENGPNQERQTANEREPYEKRYLEVRERYVEEFGVRAAGRDIVRDGYREQNGDVRPATRDEVVESTERMERDLTPAGTAVAAPSEAPSEAPAEAPAQAPASSAGGGLAATAQCESGGDYSAVNPAGYYGAYQFDMQTWQSVGGSGNPAAAPPEEQDRRAAMLYAQRGGQPWPNCAP